MKRNIYIFLPSDVTNWNVIYAKRYVIYQDFCLVYKSKELCGIPIFFFFLEIEIGEDKIGLLNQYTITNLQNRILKIFNKINISEYYINIEYLGNDFFFNKKK